MTQAVLANEAPPMDTPLLARQLPAEAAPVKPARLLSLDVFRGITLAMMTLVNNGDGESYWPLDHAKWGHGWTPTDLVFPFFLFIVGVAIPFSLGKRSTAGQSRGQLVGTIWLRALSLFMLGQLLQAMVNFRDFKPLPDGYHLLPVLRWVCMASVYGSILALLIPWRPTRRAWLIPVGVCIGFYALAGLVGLANHYYAANVPGFGPSGGGLLKPASMRIPGVLQRIGLCYGIAATLMLFVGWRTAVFLSLLLCGVYTAILLKLPFHDPVTGDTLTGTIAEKQNVARTVDEAVFDKFVTDADGHRVLNKKGNPMYVWHHTWREYPDNEGLLSTLPSIANVLIGAVAGLWLRTLRPAGERCTGLMVFGVIAVLLGLWLNAYSIPINKTIWTPAYAILTAGLALLMLGIIYYIVDINGYRRWSWVFIVLGMNSIAVYAANDVVDNLSGVIQWHHTEAGETRRISLGEAWTTASSDAVENLGASNFGKGVDHFLATYVNGNWPGIDTEQNRSVVFAASFVIVIWLLMLVLYACRIFVKV